MKNDSLHVLLNADVLRSVPVSGGDINDAYRLTLTDGRQVFMKANRTADPVFFQAEADGLEAIRATSAISVPGVIATGRDDRFGTFLLLEWVEAAPKAHGFWETFGRSLARMHQAPASRFGWGRTITSAPARKSIRRMTAGLRSIGIVTLRRNSGTRSIILT